MKEKLLDICYLLVKDLFSKQQTKELYEVMYDGYTNKTEKEEILYNL